MHKQQAEEATEKMVKDFTDLLFTAAKNGYTNIIDQLIQGGALVNDRNSHGVTPLMLAADYGNTTTAELLIDKGANVHLANDEGWTALHRAARQERWAQDHGGEQDYIGTIELLITRGAEVDKPTIQGVTPLMLAADYGNTTTAELLIDKGANVHLADDEGWTALHRAARQERWAQDHGGEQDYIGTIELLITRGAEVDKPTIHGVAALGLAVCEWNIAIVRLLIEEGANVNRVESDGRTPLISAAIYKNREAAELLLAKGAKVNHANNEGDTALIEAVGGNCCPDNDDNLECVQFLIDKGADIDHANNEGCTALIEAVRWHSAGAAKFLIAIGADIDHANREGCTALIEAVSNHSVGAAELLIDKGVDIHHADNTGKSALMWASHKGEAEAVELLIARGASVNQTDKDNKTALMHATAAGHTEIQKILKLAGAPGDIVKDEEDTCYPSEKDALGALHRFFRQRLQSILRPFMPSLFKSVNTLLLVHNKTAGNTENTLPPLPKEIWLHIIGFIPLSFTNGVFKYTGLAENSATVSSATLSPIVSFALTYPKVINIQYGQGLESQQLTKKDLGIDDMLLMESIA